MHPPWRIGQPAAFESVISFAVQLFGLGLLSQLVKRWRVHDSPTKFPRLMGGQFVVCAPDPVLVKIGEK